MKLSVEDIKELLLDCISKGAKIEYDFCDESIADNIYNSMSEEDKKIVEAVCLALRLNDFEMYSEKDIKYVYDGLELKALPSNNEKERQKMMEEYRWDLSPVCLGFYRNPDHTHKSSKASMIEKALIIFNSKKSSKRVIDEVHCYKEDPHITIGFAHHAEKGLVSFFEDMNKETLNVLVEYIRMWGTLQNYNPSIPADIAGFLKQDEKKWAKFADKFKDKNGEYPDFDTEKCWLFDVFKKKGALRLKKVVEHQVTHYEKVFNEAQMEAKKITKGQKPTQKQEAALTFCMLSWKSSGWSDLYVGKSKEQGKENVLIDSFGLEWTGMIIQDKILHKLDKKKGVITHNPTSNFNNLYRIGTYVSQASYDGNKIKLDPPEKKDDISTITPARYKYINDVWTEIDENSRSSIENKLLENNTDIEFMTLIVWLTYNIRKGYIRERQKQIWNSYLKDVWILKGAKDYPEAFTDIEQKKE